jgi:ADP-ribosylglycohydrolase
MRWWVAALPIAAGRATIKGCVRLWLGWSPEHSGVFSAGNGPAMRAPILGVCLGSDLDRLRQFVRTSTRMTHTDPKAEWGALAVAWAASRATQTRLLAAPEPPRLISDLLDVLSAGSDPSATKLIESLRATVPCLQAGQTTEEFAATLGLARGVSGYMYHTVPVAIYAGLRYPDDFRTAVLSAIRCGGDTDTVAAITGALVGARVGKSGIPDEWLCGVIDWPRSMRWVESLAGIVAEGKWLETSQRAHPLAVWALPARNALFFCGVCVHIARRLLPPY